MVKRKIRKRKFGSTGDDDIEDLFNYGTDDTESEDEEIDDGVFYQVNTEGYETVEDAIKRIEDSKNNEPDISDAYLGDRSHKQNVDNLENLSENLKKLENIFSLSLIHI